ncbi:endoplasmic reticulum vesicle transporter-domain-containing protein [Peziza echinospora]|nr:endoplasmic reticulum vesicle transporter-domain-containing protein [Peziza echinospora]
MARGSRLTRLDAFTKTVEDARVRTTTGGVVTISSIILIIFLIINEWRDYSRIVIMPELVVDKTRGQRMDIHLNITFPQVPCELLTLDVMDVSGELQVGVSHGIVKTRLSEAGFVISQNYLDLHADEATHLAKDYCGLCYGAPAPTKATKEGCCQTCEEVRDAYAGIGWAFERGEGVEQCEREHYAERLDSMRSEGCNIAGDIAVNKVIGNFHFAPGKSFSSAQMHVHDLNQYLMTDAKHTFSHRIHKLSFGPQLPLHVQTVRSLPYYQTGNPLDQTEQITHDKNYNYMYFIKVVGTSFIPLGVDDSDHDGIAKGAMETHQYSVTTHGRNLAGGEDPAHAGTVHARGGIPGVFFSYDISPMKVVNREARSKSFIGFLTGICAIIGGTLTVAAAVDRGVYEGALRVKKMHST